MAYSVTVQAKLYPVLTDKVSLKSSYRLKQSMINKLSQKLIQTIYHTEIHFQDLLL